MHEPIHNGDSYGGVFLPLTSREIRLRELEQALKTEPSKEHRRALVREYLDLTDPEPQELNL